MITEIKSNELPKYISYLKADTGILIFSVLAKTDLLSRSKEFQNSVDEETFKMGTLAMYPIRTTCANLEKIYKEELKAEASVFNCIPENTMVYRYHNGNKLALVEFDRPVLDNAVAKSIAVQVVAGNPTHLSRKDVSDYETMYQVHKEEAIKSGKPTAIAEKIAEGRMSSTLKEYVLEEQTMYNENITVGKLCERENLKIVSFLRLD